MDRIEVMPLDLEKEGYVKVAASSMPDGEPITYWCPTSNAPTLHEKMLEVYGFIAESYMRRQNGHSL